jgi:hypothetical protein
MSRHSLRQSPRSIITGAGSGFGRALAIELARRSGSLVLSDVNLTGLEETAALARAAGASSVTTLRCDVAELADVEAVATAAGDAPIDLVVNNAGISCGGLVGEVPISDWKKTIDIDLWGVIYGCHVFTPILRRQGHGAILNVASAAGLLAAPRMAPYNVAKAGVVSRSVRRSRRSCSAPRSRHGALSDVLPHQHCHLWPVCRRTHQADGRKAGRQRPPRRGSGQRHPHFRRTGRAVLSADGRCPLVLASQARPPRLVPNPAQSLR